MTTTLHVFSSHGRGSASPRIRAYRWLELLNVEADVHDYLGTTTTGVRDLMAHPLRCARAEQRLRSVGTPDRVFIQRETSPLSTGVVEERLLGGASLGIYDLDDGFPWDTAGVARRVVSKAAKAKRAVRAADRVVVSNSVLADWAAQYADDVRVIPSCIEPSDYVRKTDYAVGEQPVIGWIGSSWTLPYLRTISGALLRLHADTGARLELIGAGTGSLGPLDAIADRAAWHEQAAGRLTPRWDVAIAPLKHGPFERARSSYKLLEYAVSGVPSVSSRWGATGDVAASLGVHGADTEDEWVTALTAVLGASSKERSSLADRQRVAAENGYSYAAWAEQWRSVVSD